MAPIAKFDRVIEADRAADARETMAGDRDILAKLGAPADEMREREIAMSGSPIPITDDEARALARALRQTIGSDRFPLAPRLDPLKAILEKLYPTLTGGQRAVQGTCTSPVPQPEALPPLKAGVGPRIGHSRLG